MACDVEADSNSQKKERCRAPSLNGCLQHMQSLSGPIRCCVLTLHTSMTTPCSSMWSNRSGSNGRPTFSVLAPPGAVAFVVTITALLSLVYFTCSKTHCVMQCIHAGTVRKLHCFLTKGSKQVTTVMYTAVCILPVDTSGCMQPLA